MNIRTPEFNLNFERGELHITTDDYRKVYVNGKLVAVPQTQKPKFAWRYVHEGVVKKGDRVSFQLGKWENAEGSIGHDVKKSADYGWRIRRKFRVS